ncbi:hypothetical protein HDU97_002038 [Phlyctochytrium planicorne]|nr:hypothetical protein HDU97_002038 [Phlyctochytrium planicorne]
MLSPVAPLLFLFLPQALAAIHQIRHHEGDESPNDISIPSLPSTKDAFSSAISLKSASASSSPASMLTSTDSESTLTSTATSPSSTATSPSSTQSSASIVSYSTGFLLASPISLIPSTSTSTSTTPLSKAEPITSESPSSSAQLSSSQIQLVDDDEREVTEPGLDDGDPVPIRLRLTYENATVAGETALIRWFLGDKKQVGWKVFSTNSRSLSSWQFSQTIKIYLCPSPYYIPFGQQDGRPERCFFLTRKKLNDRNAEIDLANEVADWVLHMKTTGRKDEFMLKIETVDGLAEFKSRDSIKIVAPDPNGKVKLGNNLGPGFSSIYDTLLLPTTTEAVQATKTSTASHSIVTPTFSPASWREKGKSLAAKAKAALSKGMKKLKEKVSSFIQTTWNSVLGLFG